MQDSVKPGEGQFTFHDRHYLLLGTNLSKDIMYSFLEFHVFFRCPSHPVMHSTC